MLFLKNSLVYLFKIYTLTSGEYTKLKSYLSIHGRLSHLPTPLNKIAFMNFIIIIWWNSNDPFITSKFTC
jgi:hypothetical protein